MTGDGVGAGPKSTLLTVSRVTALSVAPRHDYNDH